MNTYRYQPNDLMDTEVLRECLFSAAKGVDLIETKSLRRTAWMVLSIYKIQDGLSPRGRFDKLAIRFETYVDAKTGRRRPVPLKNVVISA